MPASSNEFLDIQATIECGFTLKRIRDMTRTYSDLRPLQLAFKSSSIDSSLKSSKIQESNTLSATRTMKHYKEIKKAAKVYDKKNISNKKLKQIRISDGV